MLVATVEHSGTMQLLKILGRHTCPLEERERGSVSQVLFAHLYDRMMPLIEAYDGIIITTRRPLEDIRATWARRGKNMHELERQLANYERLLTLRPYIVELGQCR